MQIRRVLRHASSVAFLAILVAVSAPTVTSILAAERGIGQSLEICTAEGIQIVVDPTNSPSQSGHGESCAYCHLSPVVPLPTPAVQHVQVSMVQFLPPLFLRASRPLFAWAQSRSRAPPALL